MNTYFISGIGLKHRESLQYFITGISLEDTISLNNECKYSITGINIAV